MDPDSPSRVAELVAGSRMDSTSPGMDSASRRCSVENPSRSVGKYIRDPMPPLFAFWPTEKGPKSVVGIQNKD